MNIGMMIVFTICGAFVGLLFARLNGKLDAHTEILKEHDRKIAGIETRLDALNAAIRELTNWNTDQDASIHNILDTIIGIDTEAQNITRNLIKTDNRVTEIERYYVTYVARKKAEDDGDQIQEKPVSDE